MLPVSKIVYGKQAEQAEHARAAVALREKLEQMQNRKQVNDALDAGRLGYCY
jgi:hypothetical protein